MAFESGAISFSALQTFFGGSHPISISEYYRGGDNVPSTKTEITTYNSGTLGSNFGSGRPQDQNGWFAGTSATFPGGTATGGGQVWVIIGSDFSTPFSNLPAVGTVGSNVSVSGGSSSITGSTEAKVWRQDSANHRRIVIINQLNNPTDVTSFSMTSSDVTWTFSYVGTDFGQIVAPNTISPDGGTISIGSGSGGYNNWVARSFSYSRATSSTADGNTGVPASGEVQLSDYRNADAG